MKKFLYCEFYSQTYCQSPDIIKAEATAIYCYQCNSATDKDCDSNNLILLNKYINICPQLSSSSSVYDTAVKNKTTGGKICRKLLQNIEGKKTSLIRECGYTGDVEINGQVHSAYKGFSVYYYTCFNKKEKKSGPCNAGANLAISTTFIAAALIFLTAAVPKF
jgi:hypothetical protein